MLKVFLTVDTEVWPFTTNWRESRLSQEIDHYIYGATSEGQFGLLFQMDLLNEYGLKAVFFVEALFACDIGLEPLRKIVRIIQDRGHEVQLHLHTEWLATMNKSILPGRIGQNLKDFSQDEQAQLIERAIQNLRACGVHNLCAFRAGNFGSNFDTLHALSRNGILYDTSYNTCYLDSSCGIRTSEVLLQPKQIHGVYEFPVSFFRDYPGHYRHTQLCACSWQELENSLLAAYERGWYSFVLVSHSFELLKRRNQFGKPPQRDSIVLKRFERLCRFLAHNRDKFRTTRFSEISPDTIPAAVPSQPLTSSIYYTARRWTEQLVTRVL
jgi:peptidoglycan/xylan/chitin deacetylase (PgdA/CDA1 family)